jgi:TolA-binding protein
MAAQLREQYKQLIKDYPDSYFAEESYFRLIKSSIRDPWPPDFDTAEQYYAEYTKNYTKPRMIVTMNDFMVRSYSTYQQWERLVRFLQPYIKRYAETGNAEPAYFMYYYSDAKAALKEYGEARRGFQTIINLFPDTAEARMSQNRLKEMDKAEKAAEGDRK